MAGRRREGAGLLAVAMAPASSRGMEAELLVRGEGEWWDRAATGTSVCRGVGARRPAARDRMVKSDMQTAKAGRELVLDPGWPTGVRAPTVADKRPDTDGLVV